MTKIRIVSYCTLEYCFMYIDCTFWDKGNKPPHLFPFLLFVWNEILEVDSDSLNSSLILLWKSVSVAQ